MARVAKTKDTAAASKKAAAAKQTAVTSQLKKEFKTKIAELKKQFDKQLAVAKKEAHAKATRAVHDLSAKQAQVKAKAVKEAIAMVDKAHNAKIKAAKAKK